MGRVILHLAAFIPVGLCLYSIVLLSSLYIVVVMVRDIFCFVHLSLSFNNIEECPSGSGEGE